MISPLVLTLSILPTLLAAPLPLTHPHGLNLASRGLLSDLVDPLVSGVPIVGPLVDSTTDLLDSTVNTTLELVDPLLNTTLSTLDDAVNLTLGLLEPIEDMLGIKLELDVQTWLTCGLVSGLFGGREYDLGCSCLGDGVGLLLEVDLETVVNVEGLQTCVEAQIGLGLGAWYPSGAWPTCDGHGGFSCPGGRCGTVLLASPVSHSSVSATASASTSPTAFVVALASTTTTSSFVVQNVPTSSASEAASTTSIASTIQMTASASPPVAANNNNDDGDVNAFDVQPAILAFSAFNPSPSSTRSTAPASVSTVYVTYTITTTATAYPAAQTVTTTTTVTQQGDCLSVAAFALPTLVFSSNSPSSTPTSSNVVQIAAVPSSSSWTATASSITASTSASATSTTTSNDDDIFGGPTFVALASRPARSSTFTLPPSSTPTPSAAACPKGQQRDINLNLCLDICSGVLNDLGLCIDSALHTGLDLPLDIPLDLQDLPLVDGSGASLLGGLGGLGGLL